MTAKLCTGYTGNIEKCSNIVDKLSFVLFQFVVLNQQRPTSTQSHDSADEKNINDYYDMTARNIHSLWDLPDPKLIVSVMSDDEPCAMNQKRLSSILLDVVKVATSTKRKYPNKSVHMYVETIILQSRLHGCTTLPC